MKRLGIVGCGFLGNIIANAWKQGLLEEYELVGVTSRSWESAEKTAQNTGVRAAVTSMSCWLSNRILWQKLLRCKLCGTSRKRS